MRTPACCLTALLLVATASGQNFVVSPSFAATAESNSGNTIPWWSASARYQQIHGDLRAMPRVFQGLFLRKDAGTSNSAIARTIDTELYLCDSSFAAATTTFASNYIGTPTRVIDRKNVNLPAITSSQGSPEPWNIAFLFDRPFVYPAQNDLLWEIVIFANTATSVYSLDAYQGSDTLTGPSAILGTGCTPSGKTKPVGLAGNVVARRSDGSHTLRWTLTGGPNTSPGVLLLGPADPNTPVPGLCVNLRTAPLLDAALTTDASGGATVGPFGVAFSAAAVGSLLYVQAFVLDPGLGSGLPLAGSNGLQNTVPDLPAVQEPIQRIYATSATATSGSRETYSYGLVSRFLY